MESYHEFRGILNPGSKASQRSSYTPVSKLHSFTSCTLYQLREIRYLKVSGQDAFRPFTHGKDVEIMELDKVIPVPLGIYTVSKHFKRTDSIFVTEQRPGQHDGCVPYVSHTYALDTMAHDT